jgi:uncharacterized surface protein with fasciclin (FAS1) repeats
MFRERTTRVLGSLMAGALLLAACGDDGEPSIAVSGEAPAAPTTTAAEVDIVDTAVAAGDFTTLAAALEAADLVDTLKDDGPFTVFAPTDEAFEAALTELDLTADELLADTELLTSVLTYHVVEGEVLAEDVIGLDGEDVETVNGQTVAITVDGDTVMVNDATVVQADVMAANGVIHVIDAVLVPPG